MSAAVERGLLDAIWESPHDDTPRLIYADWLEETGEESNQARAELIRLQCELATMPGDDPRFDAFEARQEELLKTWKRAWVTGMPKGCRGGDFDRGFPLGCLEAFSLKGLVKVRAARLQAIPLWRYHYGVQGRDLDVLLPWRFLHRLQMFALRSPLPTDWAKRLADCANLCNVSELALIDCPVSGADLRLLLDSQVGRNLRELRINLTRRSNDLIETLIAHSAIRKLRRLDLGQCKLTKDDMARIVQAGQATNLVELSPRHNALGSEEVGVLLTWVPLSRLRFLNLVDNRLGDDGAQQLAQCPALANLRTLLLASCRIGARGATALAESPYLNRLERLNLYGNPGVRNATVTKMLKMRFGKRVEF